MKKIVKLQNSSYQLNIGQSSHFDEVFFKVGFSLIKFVKLLNSAKPRKFDEFFFK